MKLFVFTSSYPNEINKSAGIFVWEQCQALAKLGHKVVVLDVSGLGYKFWDNRAAFKLKKCIDGQCVCYSKHYRALMEDRMPRRTYFLTRVCASKLYKIAKEEQGKPDCVIGHFTFSAGAIATEIAKKNNVPCIIVEHYSMFLQDYLNRYIQTRLKYTVENSHFVCVSNSLANSIKKHTRTNSEIIVIPNMISDIYQYHPEPQKSSFVFFAAGNLTANKRFDLLIKAFCKAFRQDDNTVSLRVAGDGPENEKLKALIKENKRENQIILLGRCAKNVMLKEYQDCNCFALLSLQETFGIVYREAMAVGRPVIATKNGGIEEQWDNTQGIILRSDTVNDVSKALSFMKANIQKYDSKLIAFRCHNMYDSKIIIKQYEKLIFKCVKDFQK